MYTEQSQIIMYRTPWEVAQVNKQRQSMNSKASACSAIVLIISSRVFCIYR